MEKLDLQQITKLFHNLAEGIVVHNMDTSIRYFNNAALETLRISKNEMLGKTAEDPEWFFIDKNCKKLHLEDYPVMRVLQSKMPLKNMQMGIHHSEDDIIWLQINGVPLFNGNGEIEFIVISFIDITEQTKTLALLHHKTYYHSLTNLPNSIMLEKKLQDKVDEDSALVIVEIEGFNSLTQYFGKELSEQMLVFIGKILSKNIKAPNFVYHTELNQFSILLYNEYAKLDFIYSLITSLNEKELYFEKLGLNLQVLAGISFEKMDQILTAQAALNNAISDENITYSIYSHKSESSIALNNEIFWSQALRKVLETSSIKPAFQPIINNDTLKIDKYEVLMRLELDNEIYFPNSFLQISKKVKLYKYLTIALIEKVFEFFKDKDIPFSINLNTEDLLNKDINFILLDHVKYFHTPSNITIEIVESEGIENFKEVNRFLNRLKVYGCKIAIDDFGSGYSNFEYILRLDADYIKIDGSLIADIDNNNDSKDIVETIVSFARKKNIATIAEFVSSYEVYEKVKSLGVDYSQGFYFGKPEFSVQDLDQFNLDGSEVREKKKTQIKQLIYASELSLELDVNDLKIMFKHAAIRNEEHGISGYIIFDGRYFLQIIEGDELKINKLYENIVNDTRHTNILLLGTQLIENRDFESWNLGYLDEEEVIQDFHQKQTGKTVFLPHQFNYKFALEFLQKIKKII